MEYTKDHFTFGYDSSRNLPRVWKRKKKSLNREYRSKSDQLLAKAKQGVDAEDVEIVTDDLTVARFERALVRKRLHKDGTVTVGEMIRAKQERRTSSFGRRARLREEMDARATAAIETLQQLAGSKLEEAARSAYLLLAVKDEKELCRVMQSRQATDRALFFVHQSRFAGSECNAMRRNPDLRSKLKKWIEKANRIVRAAKLRIQQRVREEQASKKKVRQGRKSQSG